MGESERPIVKAAAREEKVRWTEILDVVAKLVGAGPVVAATYVAQNYQSSLTATNLLVQREQADSTLRAGMFHDLIGPIVGSANDKRGISVDRERLLAELLALNFHEHFELKPLMTHVDNRLASEADDDMTAAQRQSARDSLRSAARRVLQRQIAMLTGADAEPSAGAQQACVYDVNLTIRDGKDAEKPSPIEPCSVIRQHFNDLITVPSPNGTYNLSFTIRPPQNWDQQTFLVWMGVTLNSDHDRASANGRGTAKVRIADKDFLLTPFDFPFSDNTLLADGTRFSLVIDQVEKERASFKLVWFPQDYFAAQERPTNYRQFRDKLGLNLKQ